MLASSKTEGKANLHPHKLFLGVVDRAEYDGHGVSCVELAGRKRGEKVRGCGARVDEDQPIIIIYLCFPLSTLRCFASTLQNEHTEKEYAKAS